MTTPATFAPAPGVARVHVPDMLSREITLTRTADGGRKLVWSSNWLRPFGFEPGTPYTRTVRPALGGLEVRAADVGVQRVYERRYTRRPNNPFEAQIDIGAQSVLNAAFPGWTRRVHLTMTAGELVLVPAPERAFAIRSALAASASPLRAFVALSAGVDLACMRSAGWDADTLLEWRPREKRDTTDLTETGTLTAAANAPLRLIINEDLRTVDHARLRTQMGSTPYGLLHVSVQCDEYSAAKSPSLKAKHVEDLDTSRDLTYDVLRLIETVAPACVLVECTPGYGRSADGELLTIKLRRWGYTVTSAVLDARDYGGHTSRKRFYLVASLTPGFAFPETTTPLREGSALWETVIAPHLHECRDVTTTAGVQKGLRTGRIRFITPEHRHAPTIIKSQNRGIADGVYLMAADGRIYAPSERMLRLLNGIPDSFALTATAQETAIEQVGQSICWRLHHALIVAVRDHLLAAWRGATCTAPAPMPKPAPVQGSKVPVQGSLFAD